MNGWLRRVPLRGIVSAAALGCGVLGAVGGAAPAGAAAVGAAAAETRVVTQQAQLRASNGAIRDSFGRSVAVAGSTIVVGAEYHRVGTHAHQGAAYVYVKPASGWGSAKETAQLVASDGRAGDLFGESVAVGGNTIVVAAPFHRVGAHRRQGELYVFTRPARGWTGRVTESARLIARGGAADDYLGASISVSAFGETVVAGAYPHRVGGHAGQGAAYVFVRPGSGWRGTLMQTGTLVAAHGAAGDWLGWSVGISGATVVAGAPLRTAAGRVHQGAGYVFVRPRSGWRGTHTETARLLASGGRAHDLLGSTVAVSGGTIVAGAPNRRVGSHPYQGMLYVFVRPRSGWSGARAQTGTLIASDGYGKIEGGDVFGDELGAYSLAISAGTVVAGSASHTVGQALDRGEAYVFARPRAGWAGTHTESVRLRAADGHAGDWFGMAISVSGHTAVVGAPDHVPVNPLTPGPGAAYVFTRGIG